MLIATRAAEILRITKMLIRFISIFQHHLSTSFMFGSSQVRNCRLVGLLDLNHSKDYVRQTISGYFNTLIDAGVAGFRMDAAKHMWPGDIAAILGMTKNIGNGGRPFVVQVSNM